jgi:hypothetical protein
MALPIYVISCRQRSDRAFPWFEAKVCRPSGMLGEASLLVTPSAALFFANPCFVASCQSERIDPSPADLGRTHRRRSPANPIGSIRRRLGSSGPCRGSCNARGRRRGPRSASCRARAARTAATRADEPSHPALGTRRSAPAPARSCGRIARVCSLTLRTSRQIHRAI